MKRKVILLCTITLAVFSIAFAAFIYINRAQIETAALIHPEKMLLTSSIHTRGTLRGSENAMITAANGGRVTALKVRKGDTVTEGQFLFSVNDGKETKAYYAPFNGVIGIVLLEEGAPAIPGVSCVSVTSRDKMVVSCEVEESYLSTLALGQKVNLSLDAYPNRNYHGTVSEILPYASVSGGAAAILMEQGTTAVEVTIEIRESTSDLIPGLSVDSDIVTEVFPASLMIPCSAVMSDQEGDYVFLYENGIARKTYVKKGMYYNGKYQVLEGLEDTDSVIESPSDTLRDGFRVEIS